MTPLAPPNLYKHHRFPGEIIRHAVWRYFRFPLSHRAVEELPVVRGVVVSYEAIRTWCRKGSVLKVEMAMFHLPDIMPP